MRTKELLEHIGKILVTSFRAELSRIRLGNSDLAKTLDYQVDNDSVTLLMAEYGIYVDKGRKAGGRKVPIKNLVQWIKEKNIGSGNTIQLAYRIQTAIWKTGIKGRPFITQATNSAELIIDKEVEKWLEEEIDRELNNI